MACRPVYSPSSVSFPRNPDIHRDTEPITESLTVKNNRVEIKSAEIILNEPAVRVAPDEVHGRGADIGADHAPLPDFGYFGVADLAVCAV